MVMQLALVLEDIRSAGNVGSVFRTAEAAGVRELILVGYTPYPPSSDDLRPPHVADRAGRLIAKTALGAEMFVSWHHVASLDDALAYLRHNHYHTAALEIAETAQNVFDYAPPERLALIVGNEVTGVSEAAREAAELTLQIPMNGRKESLNVAVAAAVASYQLLQQKL